MDPMLTIALRAARTAGELIERALENIDVVTYEEKSRNDFVTEIDKTVEKEIISQLRKAYPDHSFIGEETGRSGNTEGAEYEWIIDPIDGTTNFLHSIPHFAVSIACLHKGQALHAVILDPMKREEFTASRGKGAQLNGRRMRVSSRKGLEGALIGTGIPFNGYSFENMTPYLAALQEIAGQTAGIRRPGAASLDLAYVAAGRFDGFWEMNLKSWDIAAGLLLVKEAGGLVSDFKGGSDSMKNGNVVCGPAKVFKPLLKIVGKYMGNV